MRPLFAYLRAVVVPTAVFAASEDWAGGDGADRRAGRPRSTRAAGELADLVAGRPPARAGRPVRRPGGLLRGAPPPPLRALWPSPPQGPSRRRSSDGGALPPWGASAGHDPDDLRAVGGRRQAPARLVVVDLAQRRATPSGRSSTSTAPVSIRPGVLDPAGLGDLEQVAAQRARRSWPPGPTSAPGPGRGPARRSGWRRRSGRCRCGTSAPGCSRSPASPRGRR